MGRAKCHGTTQIPAQGGFGATTNIVARCNGRPRYNLKYSAITLQDHVPTHFVTGLHLARLSAKIKKTRYSSLHHTIIICKAKTAVNPHNRQYENAQLHCAAIDGLNYLSTPVHPSKQAARKGHQSLLAPTQYPIRHKFAGYVGYPFRHHFLK